MAAGSACLPDWCILLETASYSNNNNHITRHNNTSSAILRGDYFRPQIFILNTSSHNTNFNTLPFHTWEHNQSLTLGWRSIELPLGCAHFRFFVVLYFGCGITQKPCFSKHSKKCDKRTFIPLLGSTNDNVRAKNGQSPFTGQKKKPSTIGNSARLKLSRTSFSRSKSPPDSRVSERGAKSCVQLTIWNRRRSASSSGIATN